MSSRTLLTALLGLSLATGSLAGASAAPIDAAATPAGKSPITRAAPQTPAKGDVAKVDASKAAPRKTVAAPASSAPRHADVASKVGATKRLRTSVLRHPRLHLVHRATKRVRFVSAGRRIVASHHVKRGTLHRV